MSRNRKTVGQSMKYWVVGNPGIVIKARTARVAVRKYIRGNLGHEILVRELELDNPAGCGKTPREAAKCWPDLIKLCRSDYLANEIRVEPLKGRRR